MICLRCGHCCTSYMVIIIDDPKKGIEENNMIPHMGDGPCKHLKSDESGRHTCSVHSEPWYKDTPCFSHGQIEQSLDCVCRMGEYILKNKEQKYA